MTQGLITKLLWVGLILIIFFGVSYAQDDMKAHSQQPWIYKAMEFLYQKGLIADYPLEWVLSGNELSRFELAYYIKQVIVSQPESKDIPAQTVEILQKLIAEFRGELIDLGIKITDIYKISPNLETSGAESGDYLDLDMVVSKSNNKKQEPFYYYGQYFSNLQRKTFIFIPTEYVNDSYVKLLEADYSNINIVYQPRLESTPSFLVITGNLPVNGKPPLEGYFLFPIEDNQSGPIVNDNFLTGGINISVLALLDEVNQIQQVDNLWQFNGVLSLEGYLRLDNDLHARPLVGNLNQGLKIGSLLINTENPLNKNSFDVVNSFGLPFYNSRQITPSTTVDLDAINGTSLQSIQINILGTVALSPQASLYGGLDFLYRGMNNGLDDLWPSDTKASAGVNYQFNDSWTVLTYQSFVNSQLKTGLLSTTSIGVDYNDWVTLWLAYQLLNFDNPVLSGSVAFRF